MLAVYLEHSLKSSAHDACFPARLLAGLESCHRIGCDVISSQKENKHRMPQA